MVLVINNNKSCENIEEARPIFFVNEVAPPILDALAKDLIKRLKLAFGGDEALRTEMKNQRVDAATLPPVIRNAFNTYLD